MTICEYMLYLKCQEIKNINRLTGEEKMETTTLTRHEEKVKSIVERSYFPVEKVTKN